MKKEYVVLFSVVTLVMGAMVGLQPVAESATHSPMNVSGIASTNTLDSQMAEIGLRVALRGNTAATNLTDQQVSSLMNDAIKTNLAAQLWARMATETSRLSQGADISVAVRVLECLRAGRTNDAIRELETKLDRDVAWLGYGLNPVDPSIDFQTKAVHLNSLQQAKDYWLKFPRGSGSSNVDHGVGHALSLLEKK